MQTSNSKRKQKGLIAIQIHTCFGVKFKVEKVELFVEILMFGKEEDHERLLRPYLLLENISVDRKRDADGGVDMQTAISSFFFR